MSEEVRVLFVEDDPQDRLRYSRILSETGKINVTPISPPKHIGKLRLSPAPDLVLIDYRLTKIQPSGNSAMYRGGTLANYIAEKLPETPLVIFSTKDVLNLFPNYEEEIQSADCVLYKSEINEEPDFGKKFLIILAQGFRRLAEVEPTSRTWQVLMQLLKANISENENLQRSSPPRIGNSERWHVHSVATWILRVLFRYPGILYDSLYASATLGIREEDFLLDEVQLFFQDSIYTGIFAGIKKLWWKGKLQELAFKCIREAKLDPILSENFKIAF